ncbi:hypothetical protein V6N11_000550 [Hibiscus sabdariffa]|uniref:DUF4378 domain-containing protein n=2 Tax=Hibiscus sabdariffa TaxID=183260 RepID=A0ABR2NTB8_9ROSI
MSRKTESRPATPSVIARLMGLDEFQSQQPVNKQRKLQRVLSENYLRKVASIGAWEKRSFDERHSFRFSIEETKGIKDAFEVIESVEIEKRSGSFAGKGRVDLRSSPERKHIKGSGFVDSRKGCFENGFENKVLQKLENGFVKESRRKHGHDGTSMVPRFHLESNNEICPSSRKIVIPKPGEAETNKKDEGFLGRRKGNSHAQVKERKNFFDGVKSTARRSIPSSETEREITRKLRDNTSGISFEPPRLGFSGAQGLTKEPEFLMVSSQNNSDVNNWYKPSCYNMGGSYVAQEAKQQRWRVTKDFRENGSAFGGRGRSRTLGEMLALPDHAKRANFRGPFGISSYDYEDGVSLGYKKSTKQVSSRKDKHRNLGSNCKQSQSSPDLESEKNRLLEENSTVSESETIWNDFKDREMSAEDCVVPEIYSAASQSIVSDMVVAVETPDDATKSTRNHNQHQFILEKDHNSSFCIPDAWSQQEDVSKISEECGTDPDFLVILETANQPSPVSVLEAPFLEANSLSSKCFLSVTASLNDVKRQLEFLKSESIEEYSEGPGKVFSSDDEKDAVEEPLTDYSTKLFGVAESRDFSYLVDVLTEAGFHDRHFPETPMSLSVFETLEKKYGEQMSWNRSARRLLFDRINSGLMEILQPCLGDLLWAKPVARRLSFSQNSKEIVEELYKLLVSQENEVKNELKKESSEKVFGKDDGWLSLGYDIEAIGREIENWLIDELAAEIVSI